MRVCSRAAFAALLLSATNASFCQSIAQTSAPRTLAAVLAHADDETPAGPILARYAREGVQVYLIIASDGSQSTGANSANPRSDSSAATAEAIARARANEARCAAHALGAHPPILLGFPDGKLGDYISDRSLIFRLSQRVAEELGRVHPDAVITWGPDGGVGHPDHRIVSDIVTQLQRAGAPGVPERVFYMYIPPEGVRAINPQRGEPPFVVPQAKYLTVRIPFVAEDLTAARRSMSCHRSQFSEEFIDRIFPMQEKFWNGTIPLSPAFPTAPLKDLFAKGS
jgi:LmbE family N-acetylglucosaminyl deacetylase